MQLAVLLAEHWGRVGVYTASIGDLDHREEIFSVKFCWWNGSKKQSHTRGATRLSSLPVQDQIQPPRLTEANLMTGNTVNVIYSSSNQDADFQVQVGTVSGVKWEKSEVGHQSAPTSGGLSKGYKLSGKPSHHLCVVGLRADCTQ